MKKKPEIIKLLLIVCVTYMAAAMIILPSKTMGAAETALLLCGNAVIPSLFPFIFCANIFISLGAAEFAGRYLSGAMRPLFGVSGAGAVAVVLGIVSGYPVGAVCVSALYSGGECTKTEAERLLAFCNNSGPMFIIGAVGIGMIGNYQTGVFLYITHILSALMTGFLFRFWGRNTNKKYHVLPPARRDLGLRDTVINIGEAVEKSVDTIIKICGFVILFSVFCSVLPESFVRAYIYSFFEITGGVRELLSRGGSLVLPAAAGFIAFSGISVLAQVSSVIIPSGLSIYSYIAGKLIQSILAFLLTYAGMKLLPGYISVFNCAYKNPAFIPNVGQMTAISFITLALCAMSLTFIFIIYWLIDRFR